MSLPYTPPTFRPLVPLDKMPPLGCFPYVWGVTEDDYTTEEMNRAAAAWTNISRSAPKAQKQQAVFERVNDTGEIHRIVRNTVRGDDLTVLRLFRRYHGFLPQAVMKLELVARGLMTATAMNALTAYDSRPFQPLETLFHKLVIRQVRLPGQHSYSAPFGYVCLTSFWTAVEPLPSLRATVNIAGNAPTTATTARSPVEFLMELQAFETELARLNSWKRTNTKLLPPPVVTKLTKALPGLTQRFHLFSDIFYYGETIDSRDRMSARYAADAARAPTVADPLTSLHRCLHGWLLGSYGNDIDPTIADPNAGEGYFVTAVREVRAMLVWGLQAAANTTDGWINSRLWLEWLYSILGSGTPQSNRLPVGVLPNFEGYPKNPQRREPRAQWLHMTALPILGALQNILAPMGLVECGPMDVVDPVFRFTPYGRAFFGRPDVPFPSASAAEAKPIVVQSNFEIVAPLSAMSPGDALTLSKFAKLTSAAGSPVQTFAMTDETIFRGLDAGLTADAIRTFLTDRGKTPLPTNVDRMLATWAANRERLVYSERVTVTIQPDGQYAVVPATTKNAIPAQGNGKIVQWTVQPDFRVVPGEKASALSLVILKRFTETTDGPDGPIYRLTKGSIAVALARGVTGAQIEQWLETYAPSTYFQVVSLALKNWLNPSSTTLTPVLLFAPPAWTYEFLDNDEEFRSFFINYVENDYLIDASKQKEFEAYLAKRGFEVTVGTPSKKGKKSSTGGMVVRRDEYADEWVAEPPLPRLGESLKMEQLQAMFGALVGGLPRR